MFLKISVVRGSNIWVVFRFLGLFGPEKVGYGY